ncbi:hypothetical protein KR044_009707 [Drosophila immigrans]|nr:hypothetical protein KR044_009707 [Drosophila immigrans]
MFCRCNISQCDTLNSNYSEQWVNFTIPVQNGGWNQCEHFEAMEGIDDHCERHHFNTSSLVSCDAGYVFKDNENTIAKEFGIFCSDEWKLSMVGTVNQIGKILGIPLGGYLSDIYGRKTILITASVLGSLCGLARSLALEYYSFLFLEFLNMVVASTMFPTAFLLAMELVHPKQRVVAVLVVVSTNSIAGMIMGFLAGYILDWRVLLRVLHAPGLAHLILIGALPESIYWLLSKSKEDDAIHILRRLANVNHVPVHEEKIIELIHKNRKIIAEMDAPSGQSAMRQIYNALGLRIVHCCLLWFCHSMIMLAFTINSTSLDVDKFGSFSFTHLMALPGILVAGLLMNCIDRRWAMCISSCSCSVLLIAKIFIDADWSLYLFFVAKIFATAGYVTMWFFTSEIFPTSFRNTLVSFCTMAGHLGAMLAPQTPLLTKYYENGPFLSIVALEVFASLTLLLWPETADKVLPRTLSEPIGLKKSNPLTHSRASV